jgi:hypothetical protein
MNGQDEFFKDHVHLTRQESVAVASTTADALAILLKTTAGR